MPRTVVAALVAAIVLACPLAQAAEKWTYASSDHFDVYTTAGDKSARDVLVYFERVHAFFADFLKLEPKPLHPTRLIIFSNAREYEPYRLNEVATAYYAPGPDRDYIVMRSFDVESYPLVVHEYAHLIARHSGAAYPPWLNEGLAEFFSTLVPEAGQMSIGKVPRGRLQEVTRGGLIDLHRLLAVEHGSPEYSTQNHAGMFYAESWALAHMIMTADGYRQKSGVFTTSVGGGAPAADAFQTIYGKSVENVFDDLRMYIRGEHFLYFTAKYRDPKASATSPPRAASAFEAGLVTANLLADRRGRQADARAAYDKLAAVDPGNLSLLEARAIFEMRYGERDEARTSLMKAVSAGSKNPNVYRSASTLADSAETRESLLEQAVALDPNDLQLRLSYVSTLLARRDTVAAERALGAVKQVAPDQAFMYFQLVANMSLQANEFGSAREAAGQAHKHARSDREREYASKLLQSIDAFVAERAAADRLVRESASDSAPPAAGASSPAAASSPLAGATGAAEVSALTGQLLTVIAGRIKVFDCRGSSPVLEVATDAGTVRVLVDDPLRIQVLGTAGPTTDLTCGVQDIKARIGYAPAVNAASKTVGALRLLDFRN